MCNTLNKQVSRAVSGVRLVTLLTSHNTANCLRNSKSVIATVYSNTLSFPTSSTITKHVISIFSRDSVSANMDRAKLGCRLRRTSVDDAHIGKLDGRFLTNEPSHVAIRRNALVIAFPVRTPLPRITQ